MQGRSIRVWVQRFKKKKSLLHIKTAVTETREVKCCTSWRDVRLVWVSLWQQMLEGIPVFALCIVVNQTVIWVSHRCSAVFSTYGRLSHRGRASLGGSSNACLCFSSVHFVFVFGVFHCFFLGGGEFEARGGIFPKWSHIWTTPPSPREQFMMMFECRRGARVTIGGREEWKQFGWKLNANTCASGGDVTLSWIKADTKTPCMRRRRPLITALLCLLSVMSPGSPLNPALGYWMNVSLHNSELLKPTPA